MELPHWPRPCYTMPREICCLPCAIMYSLTRLQDPSYSICGDMWKPPWCRIHSSLLLILNPKEWQLLWPSITSSTLLPCVSSLTSVVGVSIFLPLLLLHHADRSHCAEEDPHGPQPVCILPGDLKLPKDHEVHGSNGISVKV